MAWPEGYPGYNFLDIRKSPEIKLIGKLENGKNIDKECGKKWIKLTDVYVVKGHNTI